MKKYGTVLWLALVWSLFYIVVNALNKQLSPIATGSAIRVVSTLLLTLIMAFGKSLHKLRCPKRIIPWLIAIGCLGFLLDFTSFIGLQHANAGTGTVLLKIDVIFVQILSIFIYREKFDKFDWLLTFVMLGGVMLVMGVNPFDMKFQATDLFFVLSALFVTINAFLIKHVHNIYAEVTKSSDKSIINNVIAYYNNGVAMLLFFAAAFITGDFAQVQAAYTQSPLVWIVVLGGLGQVLIYTFYYKSLGKHEVWIVKIILLLIPVITLVIETIYTRQMPALDKCLGIVIVLTTAAIVIRKHGKKSANT